MSWLNKLLPPKIKRENGAQHRHSLPEGLWSKCPACEAMLDKERREIGAEILPVAKTACGGVMRESLFLLRTGQFFAGLAGGCVGFVIGMVFSLFSRLLPQEIVGLKFLIFLEGKPGVMTMGVLGAFVFAFCCLTVFTRAFKRYNQLAVVLMLTMIAISFGVGAMLIFLRMVLPP